MSTLNLHIKILTTPTSFPISQMVNEMIQIYASAGLTVNLASTEVLNLADPLLASLNDIDTGNCTRGSASAEQIALSSFRSNASSKDIVVYACRTVTYNFGALNGCASFPSNRPMAVISSTCSLYTLAHEVGHVLGLTHVNNNDKLMTGNGTNNITNPPPEIDTPEVAIIKSSPFIQQTNLV